MISSLFVTRIQKARMRPLAACLFLFVSLIADSADVAAAENNPWKFVDVRNNSCGECLEHRINGEGPQCKGCLPPLLGIGDRSCSVWTKHRVAGGIESKEYTSWLLGFIGGYNWFASDTPKKFFFHYDEQTFVENIDAFCAKAPDKPIAEAVVLFISKIHKSPVTKP